jgi:hypothetical protein
MTLVVVLGLLFAAALFFAACPPEEDGKKGDVTYTLTIPNINTIPGGSPTVTRQWKGSDGSTTIPAGVTFAYECTTTGHGTTCGVSISATGNVTVTEAALEVAHAFKATATKDGKTLATANFTVTVSSANYGISFTLPPGTLRHLDEGENVRFTPTAPGGDFTGVTYSVSACKTHTPCTLGFVLDPAAYTNPNRRRFNTNPSIIPTTVAVGDHTYTATLTKDGETVATGDFTVKVGPKYTIALKPSASYTVKKGESLTIAYELTATDGGSTAGIKNVGISCMSDYDFCFLLPEVGREWTDLVITAAATSAAEVKVGDVHSMKIEAQDDDWQPLAEADFTVTVTN